MYFENMTQNTKLQNKMVNYPFFYKDSSIILNHRPTELDDKNCLINLSGISNSNSGVKDKHQKGLESLDKINIDNVNNRIITQLDEENQNLFQMTKLQQKRIQLLEEQLHYITKIGGFFEK